jgi:hypothetical protein
LHRGNTVARAQLEMQIAFRCADADCLGRNIWGNDAPNSEEAITA